MGGGGKRPSPAQGSSGPVYFVWQVRQRAEAFMLALRKGRVPAPVVP
jgi:hypothetical protein